MDKQEFINRLRSALNGKISPSLVEENAAYYADYINTQIRLGKSEEEVLAHLGDPRLIAKTIVMANDGTAFEESVPDHEQDREKPVRRFFLNRLPAWASMILYFAVAIAVLWLALAAFAVLFPYLLVASLLIFCVKLFRSWLK